MAKPLSSSKPTPAQSSLFSFFEPPSKVIHLNQDDDAVQSASTKKRKENDDDVKEAEEEEVIVVKDRVVEKENKDCNEHVAKKATVVKKPSAKKEPLAKKETIAKKAKIPALPPPAKKEPTSKKKKKIIESPQSTNEAETETLNKVDERTSSSTNDKSEKSGLDSKVGESDISMVEEKEKEGERVVTPNDDSMNDDSIDAKGGDDSNGAKAKNEIVTNSEDGIVMDIITTEETIKPSPPPEIKSSLSSPPPSDDESEDKQQKQQQQEETSSSPEAIKYNSDGLSEYAQNRLDKIKRNEDYLTSLGLGGGGFNSSSSSSSSSSANGGGGGGGSKKGGSKRSGKRFHDGDHQAPAAAIGTRRSSRVVGGAIVPGTSSLDDVDGNGGNVKGKGKSGGSDDVDEVDRKVDSVIFGDADIQKYDIISDSSSSSSSSASSSSSSSTNSKTSMSEWYSYTPTPTPLTSLKPYNRRYTSTSSSNVLLPSTNKLTKLYSLNWHPTDERLIVGGGKGGCCCVWDLESSPSSSIDDGGDGDDGEDDDGVMYSKNEWTFRPHNNWLSSCLFIHPTSGSGSSSSSSSESWRTSQKNLLTSSSDGIVKLWDLNKLAKSSTSTGPHKIFEARNLHSKCIWSMTSVYKTGVNYVCTGSKDQTITVNSICSQRGLTHVFRGEYHDGVVKDCKLYAGDGVYGNLVGSASDDGTIAVHDYRETGAKGPSFARITSAKGSGFSKPTSLSFCSSTNSDTHSVNEHLLLTSGIDSPLIKVYDLRKPTQPLLTLRGHASESFNKRNIHCPEFYSVGTSGTGYVISGGDGTNGVSLYNLASALSPSQIQRKDEVTPVSRGKLNADAGPVAVQQCGGGYRVAVASDDGSGGVYLMGPR